VPEVGVPTPRPRHPDRHAEVGGDLGRRAGLDRDRLTAAAATSAPPGTLLHAHARIRQTVCQKRRLEQPRIQLPHHLPRRHRRQVRRPLMAPFDPSACPNANNTTANPSSSVHTPNISNDA
jgi:hypothetical protein